MAAKGLLKIFFGFAGKAYDDVGGKSDVGAHLAQLLDGLKVMFARIASMHRLENRVRA